MQNRCSRSLRAGHALLALGALLATPVQRVAFLLREQMVMVQEESCLAREGSCVSSEAFQKASHWTTASAVGAGTPVAGARSLRTRRGHPRAVEVPCDPLQAVVAA